MWMMPLHLHVNQKSDYDYDDDDQVYVCRILKRCILLDKMQKERSLLHENFLN